MEDKKVYYLTTAIAYASGKPHIGNTYEAILADAIVRYKRFQGYDVRFMTGTDEHGQKIEQKAKEKGVTPKEYVDEAAGEIRRIWDLMGTSYDRFIRTTDPDHEALVQKVFRKLYDQGDIYKGEYEGLYCVPDESFFTPSQAPDGICPDCGRPLVKANEEAYFFKMSKYADRLIEHINTHPQFIQPESRKNEIMNNFLLPGLQDLCVSRTSFKWGVPVDFDPKHVVYVWIDALTNYISGLGYKVDEEPDELFKKYWPADVHLIGKDILRFHTIYWPIMLMALGVELPKQIFGHPWLIQGGEKMSKSRGNVLYADDLASVFGVDAVHYFVMHETPFENDGQITWSLMLERYNSDLANILGNLVSRTAAMANKYFGGVLNETAAETPFDQDLKTVAMETVKKAAKDMDALHVADALTDIFTLFKRLNKYIDETCPWVLAKDPEKQDELANVLYNLASGIMIGANLLQNFMPETARKIAEAFSCALTKEEDLTAFNACVISGTKVAEKPEMLFKRLEEKDVMARAEEIMALQRAAAGVVEEPAEAAGKPEEEEALEHKPEITFDDFQKMEFRVGEIISCEEVPKSKKLLCSQVKIGSEIRQIVSGIKASYKPEDMVGKKVVVVVNLKPAKLAGVLSEGMILCADGEDGASILVTPEKDAKSGAEVR
ncbi:MAG: methionine--tRNA ligase [Lachnospiraceae bacterium]|nr:methionine--tRNA ligase [Lachnospiraceae bacterium]